MENNRDYIRVYLAGKLRGNWLQKRINVWWAKRTAKWLWQREIAVYCPHTNSGFVDDPKTDEFVMRANKDFIYSCDAMLVMKGWENSEGTIAEIRSLRNQDQGMYIYHDKLELFYDIIQGRIGKIVSL